jgi:Domain of unknown function (DU1801)
VKQADKAFEKTIANRDPLARKTLTELRALILETAKATPGVGAIEEGLRWGQHSFLTTETGSGSTIRIDTLRSDVQKCAIYFHCQSGLVDMFRNIYLTKLSFDGNRAIVFKAGKNLPKQALSHCIGLALTHHLRKKSAGKNRDGHESTNHHRHRSGAG